MPYTISIVHTLSVICGHLLSVLYNGRRLQDVSVFVTYIYIVMNILLHFLFTYVWLCYIWCSHGCKVYAFVFMRISEMNKVYIQKAYYIPKLWEHLWVTITAKRDFMQLLKKSPVSGEKGFVGLFLLSFSPMWPTSCTCALPSLFDLHTTLRMAHQASRGSSFPGTECWRFWHRAKIADTKKN